MIRILNENDRDLVLNYLYIESSYNIFIIGDIEAFGFHTVFQYVLGEIDELDNLLSVFLKYRDNGIYYSHLNRFNPEFMNYIKLEELNYFSAKSELMDLIKPYLNLFRERQMFFCKANRIKKRIYLKDIEIKKMTSLDECYRLYNLLSSVEEFGISKRNKDEFAKTHYKSLKMGTTFYIEENEKIVSTVTATAETKKSAMIIAVATDSNYRGRGYVSTLLTKLMEYYFNIKKKELCLFYDNLEAGNIYTKLGFEHMGKWTTFERISH